MSQKARSTPVKKGSRKQSPAPTPAGALVVQAHGGALKQGGNPGNKGGTGQPPSLIRSRLRGSFSERIRFLEEVADGRCVQRIRLRVSELIQYVECRSCKASDIRAKDDDAAEAEILVDASASVKDRLSAVDMTAKYGLGALKEVSSESVRERIGATLDILQTLMTPEQFARACEKIEPVWA